MAGKDNMLEAKVSWTSKKPDKEHCESGHDHAMPFGVRRSKSRAIAAQHRGLKPMRFVSLHHHTTYSYLDGFQLPAAHIRRAGEIEMGAIAFTEHGNVSSHVKAEVAAEGTGVKPIYGCEVYTGKVGEGATQKKNHLTVLAATDEGYINLMQLVSKSFAEGFHYEPTVEWAMLKRHKKGLIILSGCQGSVLFTSLVGGKHVEPEDASYARAKKVAAAFKREFGDAYYLEVQAFPELEKARQANPMIVRMGKELGIPVVATMDCHYTAPEESEIQQILHNVRPGEKRTMEEMARTWGYHVPLCPPTTDRSIWRRLVATGLTRDEAIECIVNTEVVSQRCSVTLPKLPTLRYPIPSGMTDVEYWRQKIKEGWDYRGVSKWPSRERARAKRQLAKELRIIEGKDFVSYFLVVSDILIFAKDYRSPEFPHGIAFGPARGSAAASLICWLLRITEVNPMLYPNLVFERFIDDSRQDLPDIDIDAASEGRPIIRDYAVSKYGSECVSNIGTFTQYRAKNSLDDVARVHRIPKFEVAKLKDLLIERSSGDLRASATIEDTVEQFDVARDVVERFPELRQSMQLEGNVKQFGVHAAGLVVSNGPITDVCAVYEREVKGEIIQVISMDKYDAERQGLIKIDLLGLSTMSALAEVARLLDMPLQTLYDLPLNDKKALAAFKRNDVTGIFQFAGDAVRMINGQLQPDDFNEVMDVTALCRPGPLHNGAANEYIRIKKGLQKPERIHEALDLITQATNYQIVYQEQILRIVREIGGFDWTGAAYIRKIISKKLGEAEFNRQISKYLDGVSTVHERLPVPRMTEATGRQIWGMCTTAGSYAFNFAHTTAYGMISMWSQYLKQHEPAAFYAGFLAKMPDSQRLSLMRDAEEHGKRIRPPHVQRSERSWSVGRKGRSIQAGFEQIEGVGDKMAPKIVEFRDQTGATDWRDLLGVPGIGAKTVEKIEAFVKEEDPFKIFAIDRKLNGVREELEKLGLPYPTHKSLDIPYESGKDEQICWMGVITDRNLRDIFESNRARTGEELDPKDVKSPHLNEFALCKAVDELDIVSVRFNRFVYPQFKNALWKIRLGEDVVLVRGVKPKWRSAREIYVSQLWVLDPED